MEHLREDLLRFTVRNVALFVWLSVITKSHETNLVNIFVSFPSILFI